MTLSLRNQAGYLTMVIVLLIVTVGFAGLVTSYEFSNKASSINYSQLSMQAYYMAESGLERAKYDITVKDFTCSAINGTTNYTAATFPNAAGQFTVTGASSQNSTTLNGALTSTATTIPLTSSTGFASLGTILIDNELINYTAISGNNLTVANRGVGGTTAAAHLTGAVISQNQCLLTSTGAVPTIASPLTKRIIQETLIGSSFSPGQNGSGAGTGAGSGSGAGSGLFQTAMAIGGSVSLGDGAVINNSNVTASSTNFSGSTIMSGGPVVINGTGKTQISNGSGGLVTSSSAGNLNGDIAATNSLVSSANLWGNFFTQSKATVQASANNSYTSSNINGATGQTIWINDLNISSATTIGSATSPVILIVSGNINVNNSFTLYGLLYATGSVAFNSSGVINGLFALEGAFNSNGSTTVNYNPGILTKAASLNPNTNNVYSITPAYSQEQFA